MKETPLSNCERAFINKAITLKHRLDGRSPFDYRNIKISFGTNRGCSIVDIGDTKVLAQISSEIVTPKDNRPSEGLLFINVELPAPQFEANRQSEFGVVVTRMLERSIKESRCVDTESLCIIYGLKVWSLRIDIHVLNHSGNVVDCACIAAMSALHHFRIPDVTVCGDEVTVHPTDEKDPLPIAIHHTPLCVTFMFYHSGRYLLVDPGEKEEVVAEGKMVISLNKYREICAMAVTGKTLLLKEQVTEINELIQKALQADAEARAKGLKAGFAQSIPLNQVTANQQPSQQIETRSKEDEPELQDDVDVAEASPKSPVARIIAPGTSVIGHGGVNAWGVAESDDEADARIVNATTTPESPMEDTAKDKVVKDDDSEEEVAILQSDLVTQTTEKKTSWKTDNTGVIDLTAALIKPGTASRKRKNKNK